MEYSLSNSLVGGSGSLNLDKLSLDLQFATDKTLTARRGPTPVFTRATTGTFVGSNGSIQSAAINVARFDHDTSYVGSSVYVTSSDAIGDSGSPLPSERVYFAGMDGNGYPEFTSSMYYISFSSGQWLLNGDAGKFIAHSDVALSDEYVTDTGTGFVTVLLTLACKGLLIEESRTNLVFPSATLTTQTRTVTAVAHTLSFYGTGTVVLSGVHVATVTGTGGFPTRTTLTFTPTAGSLTLTVTGSVTEAQLEAGSFATSYIPTTTTALERTADVCSITGGAFTGMYNSLAGTIVARHFFRSNSLARPFYIGDGTSAANTMEAFCGSSAISGIVNSGSLSQYSQTVNAVNNTMINTALAVTASSAMLASNGTLATAGGGLMPVGVNQFIIGNRPDGVRNINGHISYIRYFKKRLPNAKLQTLTT